MDNMGQFATILRKIKKQERQRAMLITKDMGLIWCRWFKISNQMLKDQKAWATYIKYLIDKEKLKFLKAGVKLVFQEMMMSNEHEDNFVNQLTTVAINFKRYKLPRIAKHQLN